MLIIIYIITFIGSISFSTYFKNYALLFSYFGGPIEKGPIKCLSIRLFDKKTFKQTSILLYWPLWKVSLKNRFQENLSNKYSNE